MFVFLTITKKTFFKNKKQNSLNRITLSAFDKLKYEVEYAIYVQKMINWYKSLTGRKDPKKLYCSNYYRKLKGMKVLLQVLYLQTRHKYNLQYTIGILFLIYLKINKYHI